MKPSAPVLLEVVGLTEDSVTLSWLSPERDGGSKIFRYVIERRELSKPNWVQVKKVDASEILVACIEGLRDGISYLFRVFAENEVGAGPAVELREAVVPRSQLGSSHVIIHLFQLFSIVFNYYVQLVCRGLLVFSKC